MPTILSTLPFAVLLVLIALGPLLFERWWHRAYPVISVGLASIIIGYYLFSIHDLPQCIHPLAEYLSFITLLAALYFASGGIVIQTDEIGAPTSNIILLGTGAILASMIGTTGAAMILIRPFINMNKQRLGAYQKVFFIFIVCNAGGLLTPIGDPPLFIGFLKGVPFFWISRQAWPFWLLTNALLIGLFYVIDKRNNQTKPPVKKSHFKLKIEGGKNIIFLVVAILLVFLDPNIKGMYWVPAFHLHESRISFIREILLILICVLSYRLTDKKLLHRNEFTLSPIKEVAFLFFGLFLTMMPVLQWVQHLSAQPNMANYMNQHNLFWLTGALSAILDNAPTYLNSMSAAMGAVGLNVNQQQDVLTFLDSHLFVQVVGISVAAVLFGAFTYLGNAPNLMVKAIAEQKGIKMPSFFEYIFKYSIPILLPIILLNWLLFYFLHG
jgi:Na+/H+ antiporter NhaD/arsenite permease-like protein